MICCLNAITAAEKLTSLRTQLNLAIFTTLRRYLLILWLVFHLFYIDLGLELCVCDLRWFNLEAILVFLTSLELLHVDGRSMALHWPHLGLRPLHQAIVRFESMVLARRNRRLHARQGPRRQLVRLSIAAEDVAASRREARLNLGRIDAHLIVFPSILTVTDVVRHKPALRRR